MTTLAVAISAQPFTQESANLVVAIFAGFICGPVAFVPSLPGWMDLSFPTKIALFLLLFVLYYAPLAIVARVSFGTQKDPADSVIARRIRRLYFGINIVCECAYLLRALMFFPV